MQTWTKTRRIEATPTWVLLSLVALSCGQTSREYDSSRKEQPGPYRPVPIGSGSGGTKGSAGGDEAGGQAGSESEREPGSAGRSEPEPEPEPAPEPVWPSDCTPKALTASDPNTGLTWSTVYLCKNDGNAPVYERPDYANHVATMQTTESWFVCWSAGQPHAGNNDIWYYTQGDASTSGWDGRHGWGFMAAVNVHTRHDPDSAIPECPF